MTDVTQRNQALPSVTTPNPSDTAALVRAKKVFVACNETWEDYALLRTDDLETLIRLAESAAGRA